MNDVLLIEYMAFAVALFWACLARLRHVHKGNTRRPIRWAFTALTVMAFVCLLAPLLWHYQPDRMATALLGLLAITQITTSHFWRQGVPPQFRKDPT